MACRAELRRFPSSITITQKLLNYIYIQSKTEDSFVEQTFLMSFDLHSNGKVDFTPISWRYQNISTYLTLILIC